MYKLRQTTKLDGLRELHAAEFDGSDFPENDTFWIAVDANGKVVGFASAEDKGDGRVYISRQMVCPAARGHKLQRRFTRAQGKWARKRGATQVITYTLLQNYPSMVNLLACGFQFYKPGRKYVGDDVHYFRLELK